jgi:HSP20 family protein
MQSDRSPALNVVIAMKTNIQAQQDSFDHVVRHMGDMVDELLKQNFFRASARDAWQPALNLYEAPDCYVVCVELAGMDRDKIDVQVGNGALYIRGDRPKPQVAGSPDDLSVHVMEIDSGPFKRKVPVPDDVDQAGIQANYRNGYLWVVMPRTAASDHSS